MDRTTEELLKEREAVHPKCQGKGFAKDEEQYLVSDRCNRIAASELFLMQNPDVKPTKKTPLPEDAFVDDACRCSAYAFPSSWWRDGRSCPLASHFKLDAKDTSGKVRVGQQKQRKRRG